jgi:hypothetical protein
MSSLSGGTNGELGELGMDGTSAQHGSHVPIGSQSSYEPSHAPDRNGGAVGIQGQTTSEGQNEPNANTEATESHQVAPAASSLVVGDSEDEPGAFDDSHLQVDEPKKKKKKKAKRKPKSKRGLVIHDSSQMSTTDARFQRMPPPGSKSIVQMLQLRQLNMMRSKSSTISELSCVLFPLFANEDRRDLPFTE